MRRMNQVMVALTMMALSTIAVRGASSATKASATTKPVGRLFAPYSKMTSLSDDQRQQIETLHRKALADVKEIEAKENTDIMALLSDDQKKELRDLEEKTSSDRKTKSGSKTDMNN